MSLTNTLNGIAIDIQEHPEWSYEQIADHIATTIWPVTGSSLRGHKKQGAEQMTEVKALIAELIDSGAEITFSRYFVPDVEPLIRIDAVWRQAHKELGCLITKDSWELATWEPSQSLHKMLLRYREETGIPVKDRGPGAQT